MDLGLVVVIAAGAALAGFVQGLTGFGFSMVSLAVWAWMLDPALAAVLSVFGGWTGQVIAAVTVRRGFDLKLLLPFAVGGALGVPVGATILPLLDVSTFKVMLGLLLVIWCPIMIFSTRLPHIRRGGRVADGVIGLIGGVMGGLGGFSGVVPTLWCTLRGMSKDSQRVLVQNLNLLLLSLTLTAYLSSGLMTREVLPALAVVVPAMLIPALLGARLYTGISDQAFKRLVLGMLTAAGIAMLAAGLPVLLGR